jgi:hypothetical protein
METTCGNGRQRSGALPTRLIRLAGRLSWRAIRVAAFVTVRLDLPRRQSASAQIAMRSAWIARVGWPKSRSTSAPRSP